MQSNIAKCIDNNVNLNLINQHMNAMVVNITNDCSKKSYFYSNTQPTQFRPNMIGLDFVNRGEDKDEHVANCFFGDIAIRKLLDCHQIIYDYSDCSGVTKQVINNCDYDCSCS